MLRVTIVFREQNQHMLPYTQQQVGIEDVFCCPEAQTESLFEEEEDLPYAEPCDILRELTYIVVPSDMLFCLWRTGRSIYEVAQVCGMPSNREIRLTVCVVDSVTRR